MNAGGRGSSPRTGAHAHAGVRTAYARHLDPVTSVDLCVAQIGPVMPALLMVFCGGKHDPHIVRAAFRAAFGDVPVVGGAAVGAMTFDGLGYSGLEIAVVAFVDTATTPRLLVTRNLLDDEQAAGHDLGVRLRDVASPGSVVLLLFDSVAVAAPLRLHPASTIVEGLQQGLAGYRIDLFGGGLLTDLNLSDGWVFTGEDVARHAAVAVVFPPSVTASTVVMHGCRPVSTFMHITRIEGAEVFELDGEPALTVIERRLGLPLGGAQGHDLTLLATLGEKHGDLFSPYDERDYVNRLIVTCDRDRGSVTLFEPDFHVGTTVQIMSRDNALMLQSVRDGVAASNAAGDTMSGSAPLLTMYIDCAGRASARSGAATEEAALVLSALDRTAPMIGFYSGVEIAPFKGYSRPLDWTGVLTTLRVAL